MIIREWRGRTELSRAHAYVRHFRAVVIPELHRVAGFLGAYLTQHQAGELLEFVVITKWDSMDAIRAFAGPSPEKAVVEPGAAAALKTFDKTVHHYEVLEDVRPA
jgi:heme-degrading monooxygenase HmoA